MMFFLMAPLVLVMALAVGFANDPRALWRFRSRRPAEKKGIVLLRSWLTPEQVNQWDSRGEFEVTGCDTGIRYRITCGTVMNVHQLDLTGKTVRQWCFRPEGKLAVGDVLLAQKIALENMERRALDLANSQVRSTQVCFP